MPCWTTAFFWSRQPDHQLEDNEAERGPWPRPNKTNARANRQGSRGPPSTQKSSTSSNSISSSAQRESHCSRFYTVQSTVFAGWLTDALMSSQVLQATQHVVGIFSQCTETQPRRLSNQQTHSPSTSTRNSGHLSTSQRRHPRCSRWGRKHRWSIPWSVCQACPRLQVPHRTSGRGLLLSFSDFAHKNV